MAQVGIYESYPYGHVYKYLDLSMTLPSTPVWIGSFFGVASSLHDPGNQYVLNIQANISIDTLPLVDSQKAAVLGLIKTNDPSGAILRDAIGVSGMAYINPLNPTGRAWGMFAQSMILAGGDGLLVGHEISIRNQGTDVAAMELPLSKYGLMLVTRDTAATCRVFINRAGASTWHKGVFSKQAYLAVGGTFLELEGLFTVDRYGIMTCQAARYGIETLTISGGIITVTKSDVKVDTEAGAASDDLDTINGGVLGQVITLGSVNSVRDIVIKNLTGNIHSMGADRTLLDVYYRITLMYDGAFWVMVSRNF